MNIGVTYDTSTEKLKRAIEIITETYKSHPLTADLSVGFNKFADSALNINVVHFWNSTDYKAYLEGLQAMNLQLKKRFDDEGIEFAFPSQTVYVKSDSDARTTPPALAV
jgi:MscS family membrane protein